MTRPDLAALAREVIPMLLHCPWCCERHIDAGEFATKPHHTHACQYCGHVWRPALVPTVGVQFLPGFKDEVRQEVKLRLQHELTIEQLRARLAALEPLCRAAVELPEHLQRDTWERALIRHRDEGLLWARSPDGREFARRLAEAPR